MNKPNPADVCESIMEHLLKGGYSYQVPRQDLEKAILWIRGMDKRTINRWIEVMVQLEYVKVTTKTKYATIYEMNIAKIPNLVSLLRKIPQTHLAPNTHTQSSKGV